MKRLPFIYKKNNKSYSITNKVYLSSYIHGIYFTYCYNKNSKPVSKYEKT